MFKHLLTALLLSACAALPAQNLIPNGGFEDYKQLPTEDGCFNGYIEDWLNLNGKEHYPNGTPDYLHTKGAGNGKVSNHYFGEVEPYKGDAMMGVIVMPQREFYEYVSARVPVKKGKRYEFSMYITNGNPKYCGCSGQGFGMLLSENLPDQKVAERVKATPQWRITDDFHTKKWENIRFRFTAQEDYQYLTLGYFASPSDLHMKPISGSSDCIYFFVDEISLTEVNDGSTDFVSLNLPASVKNVATDLGTPAAAVTETPPTPPAPILSAQFTVLDKNTQKPLPAQISVLNLNTNEEVWKGELTVLAPSAEIQLPDPAARYGIFARSSGYVDGSEKIEPVELKADMTVTRTLLLSPIKKGETIVLKNIYFDTGKYDLLPPSFPELDKLTRFLQENPDVKIEVAGHTDNQGSDAMNLELSNNRAKAVYTYLLKNIDKSRMVFKGYGETTPVSTNDTPEGRQQNRRVEFRIL